jgi:thymidylate synthase (FAD)
MKIIEQKVELLWATPDGEKLIEQVARTCYKSEGMITDDSAENFVRKLRDRKHFPMLEFADVILKFTVDRGGTHETVRHRLASYAQESTRYCNYSAQRFNSEITVVRPLGYEPGTEAYEVWKAQCESAEQAYFHLLETSTPQMARSVLPTCLKSELCVKMNLTAWRHVLTLRRQKDCHPQMIAIMNDAFELIRSTFPAVFEDLA